MFLRYTFIIVLLFLLNIFTASLTCEQSASNSSACTACNPGNNYYSNGSCNTCTENNE